MKNILILILLILATFICKGQWTHLNESFGGNTVGTVKAIGNDIYTGTFSFGSNSKVYKSNDYGANWTLSNSGIGSASVHTFATIGSTIFAATYSQGVFKSTNNGLTWITILNNIPNVSYYSLTTLDSVIIVGTDLGELYQSPNLGSNWIKVDSASVCNYINTLKSSTTNIFAATCNGILTSVDSGVTWAVVDSGLTNNEIGAFGIKDSFVFATDGFRVYRTSNNGASWNNVTSNLYLNSFKRSFGVSGNNIIIGTQTGVFVSSDNGQNWFSANAGIGNNEVNAFDTLSNYIFAATNSGVFRLDSSQLSTIGAAVSEINNPTSLSIFPNPFSSQLSIGTSQNEKAEIILYDFLSRMILQKIFTHSTTINTEQLTNGIYFYEVRNKIGISTKGKIIKQ